MASVVSQLIEEVTAHVQSDSPRMRKRYAQTVLTFRITYVLYTISTQQHQYSNIMYAIGKEKNQCIRQKKTGARNIVKKIKQYQKKWLQHVQRMDTNILPKQALQYKQKG